MKKLLVFVLLCSPAFACGNLHLTRHVAKATYKTAKFSGKAAYKTAKFATKQVF